MNKTEHYGLPQWEESDRILMDDFNAMNAAIDAALGGKANAAAVETLQTTVGGMVKIAAGSYVGTGEYGDEFTKTLDFADTLGRAPAFLIVTKDLSYDSDLQQQIIIHRGLTYAKQVNSDSYSTYVKLVWGDTSVGWTEAGTSRYAMNENECTYQYFAIG